MKSSKILEKIVIAVITITIIFLAEFLTPEHITGHDARIYQKKLGLYILWGGFLLLAVILYIYKVYKESRHKNPKK